MTRSSSWEPTILHQDRNTVFVAFELPMENARGDV